MIGALVLAAAVAATPPPATVDEPNVLLSGMVISQDPGGGTVYQPHFLGRTRSKWRIYAALVEKPDGTREVTLHVTARGFAPGGIGSIDFEIDDDESHLKVPSEGISARQISACRPQTDLVISGQEDLVRSLAKADYASLSFSADPEKRQFRLHDFELDQIDRVIGLLDADDLPRPLERTGSGKGTAKIPKAVAANPVLILESKVQPIYPEAARRRSQSGRVILQALVGEDGSVRSLEPLESKGGCAFEQSAIAAVKQWRYKPATRNGRPVAVYFTIVVDFKLEKAPADI